MTEPDALDPYAVAAELGVHYDTFRKRWRAWADPTDPAYCAFPPPFRAPPPGRRGTYAWRRSAVAAWKENRERALGAALPPPAPPGRRPVPAWTDAGPAHPALAKQRALLARLMQEGA